ncbi:hypothetical protein [Arthrobacter antibioticus]|uniref:hypothetical protein n=1 Tax=Arthrobacter sp. H35-MC1 TaxID=3046203 RepID=UPI0024B925DB|nr:hypothetical protein [Arthrobacter sp. H35-MC1]MDJ0318894.1 hypothetical protein [Arthrobacter sp. H35-MC1]
MTRYTVTAEESGPWWSLQCVEVPGAISQVKHLADAHIITEAIAHVGAVDEDDIVLTIQPVLPFNITPAQCPPSRAIKE